MHLGLHIALMLLTASRGASAATWTVNFGGCNFTGEESPPLMAVAAPFANPAVRRYHAPYYNCVHVCGAPLVRSGSCSEQSGTLDLSYRNTHFGITALPANVFQNMSQMT